MTVTNNYYTDGTVSITNGATALTGSGTAWDTAEITAGDKFVKAGYVVRIASVDSDTGITLAEAWPGTTLSGATYAIEYLPGVSRSTQLLAYLYALIANGILAAFGALTGAADKIAYFTGAATMDTTDFGAEARETLAVDAASSDQVMNLGLADSVAGSALTLALKQADGSTDPTSALPVIVGFRDATLANGNFNRRKATAATSIVVPSGATLGQTSAVAANLYVYLIDYNSGTLELAVSGKDFGESGRVSTTAIDTSADSATVMYSTTARSNVPFRKIAACVNTQATAGTWAAAMSTKQLAPFGEPEGESFKTIKTTVTAYFATLADDADAATARTTLGLAIGTDVQPAGQLIQMAINGSFAVSQFAAATTDNGYAIDGWRLLLENANGATAAQDTADVPTGAGHALKLTVGSGNNGKFGVMMPLENHDILAIRGGVASLRVPLKATAGLVDGTGKIRIGIAQFTGTADAISGDPISSWGAEGTNPTLAANWAFANTPAALSVTTSWGDFTLENVSISASATNLAIIIWCDDRTTTTTTDILRIGGYVTLVQGAKAPVAMVLPFGEELARCQRYFCKSFAPATNPAEGVASTWWPGFAWATTNMGVTQICYPVQMRVAPTVTYYKPAAITGTNGMWQWFDGSAYQTASAMTTNAAADQNGFSVSLTVSGLTFGRGYIVQGHFTADARL